MTQDAVIRNAARVGRLEQTDENGIVRPLELLILCPAGFQDIVADTAAAELPKFVESARSSGLVRGRAVASVRQLQDFRVATNVFSVIDEAPRTDVDREARHFAERLVNIPRPTGLAKKGTTRLRIHDDGEFTSTNRPAAVKLEDTIGDWSKLRVSRRSATIEIWLIRRAERDESVLATKLTSGQHRPERGELRSEICAALARAEPLANAHLVLDPFAGSGAIGHACLAAGAKSVWLNDLDKSNARTSAGPRTRWTDVDFRELKVQPGTVHTIVTDPPWGHHVSVDEGIDELYSSIGSAASEWLRPGGALVVLTGAPDSAIRRLLANDQLHSESDVPVLINGRKARVIRARRTVTP